MDGTLEMIPKPLKREAVPANARWEPNVSWQPSPDLPSYTSSMPRGLKSITPVYSPPQVDRTWLWVY